MFVLGALLCLGLARYFRVPAMRALVLYVWHTVFCIVYMDHTLVHGGDAVGYYRLSLSWTGSFEMGTEFVNWLTGFYSRLLGMSYLGAFLAFNIFGAVGMLALYGALRIATEDKSLMLRRLALLIMLLPSISFWSSAIGKDSLAFMSTCLALWAALDMRRRSLLLFFAIAVMLLVRPHVAAAMVLAMVISTAFNPNFSLVQRTLLGTVALAGAAAMVPFALTYAGLGTGANAADVMDYIELRQSYNLEGGGGIDIASMSPPMQLFTYLFRPLPFEAHSIFALAAAFDNVLLLGMFFMAGRGIFAARSSTSTANHVFLWAYALVCWVMLALTTANLGISMRQKWMFTPILIYLLLAATRGVRRPVPAATPGTSIHPTAGVASSALR